MFRGFSRRGIDYEYFDSPHKITHIGVISVSIMLFRKQLLDVQELIEIKHRYKNVIEGKPKKHKVEAFSKSRYIKATCLWETCPCHKQEVVSCLKNIIVHNSEFT
jgi:hypothetical protein